MTSDNEFDEMKRLMHQILKEFWPYSLAAGIINLSALVGLILLIVWAVKTFAA